MFKKNYIQTIFSIAVAVLVCGVWLVASSQPVHAQSNEQQISYLRERVVYLTQLLQALLSARAQQDGVSEDGESLSSSTSGIVSGRGMWRPRWLTSNQLSFATNVTEFAPHGCNTTSYAKLPRYGNLFIGRELAGRNDAAGCGTPPWHLVYTELDERQSEMEREGVLLDTSLVPVRLDDGNIIDNAYDASTAVIDGEIWVAFECSINAASPDAGVGTCAGPLDSDLTINLSRTTLVIKQNTSSDGISHTASVPKLLVHQEKPYLYWSMVDFQGATNSPENWRSITTRGVAVDVVNGRLFASGVTRPIAADDRRTVEIFGVDENDVRSNMIADVWDVASDGESVYFTAARGGEGCISPSDRDETNGCYRLAIGKADEPLQYRGFNQQLIPERYLPTNAASYVQFSQRSATQSMLTGYFFPSVADSDIAAGMKQISWPIPLEINNELTVDYDNRPADREQVDRNALVNSVYQCVLNRPPRDREYDRYRSSNSVTIESLYQGVFGSSEYRRKNQDDASYVSDVFRCVLNRTVGSAGLRNNLAAMANGMSRDTVLRNVLTSKEFSEGKGLEISERTDYPIVSQPEPEPEPVPAEELVVNHMYQCILGRSPNTGDSASVQQFVQLVEARNYAALYQTFFGSQEYIRKEKSDEAFVKDAFECVLFRTAGAGGLANWMNQLAANVMTRLEVVDAFVNGAEFQNLDPLQKVNVGEVRGVTTTVVSQTQIAAILHELTKALRQYLNQ